MTALARGINADESILRFTEPVAAPFLMLGDEVVQVLGHPRPSQRYRIDKSVVTAVRGITGQAQSHSSGTTVTSLWEPIAPARVISATGDAGLAGEQGIQGETGPQGPEGPQGPAGAGVTTQLAVANVDRSGIATTQISNLQNKVDEILVVLRNAGVIQT